VPTRRLTTIGLLHIVLVAVRQHYVEDYHTVVRELERIARVRPSEFSADIDELLVQLPWDKVFDFCERFYNHLAQDYQERTQSKRLVSPSLRMAVSHAVPIR